MKKTEFLSLLEGRWPLFLKLKVWLGILKKYFLIRKRGPFQGLKNREGLSQWDIPQ